MSYYYWFNRNNFLKNAHDKYHKQGGKEVAAIYYERNKNSIKRTKRKVKKIKQRRKRQDKRNIKKTGILKWGKKSFMMIKKQYH